MEWYFILLLVLASPVMLFAVAYVWYLSLGGTYALITEARMRGAARRLAAADAGPGEEGGKRAVAGIEKMYIVCQRCSRTVDAGRDGHYPEPVFVPGYCAPCSRFLMRRAADGEGIGRLGSVVLIAGGAAPSAGAIPAGRGSRPGRA